MSWFFSVHFFSFMKDHLAVLKQLAAIASFRILLDKQGEVL